MEIKMTSPRTNPWKAALACVMAGSLTACSASRSQNVWNDLGPHQTIEATKISPPSQKWGKEAEGPDVADPQIVPGLLLSIRSTDDAKLNKEYRVEFDGTLALPYDMTVNTTGLTQNQLEKKLNDMYRPYFKTAPSIKVRVQERRYSVDVRGLVEKPGRYLVEQNTSLDQVITMAGGLSKESLPRFVRIQKGPKSLLLDLQQYLNKSDDRSQITAWIGGEMIFFQKDVLSSTAASQYRLPIHIMGAVRKPGEYPLKAGADIVDVITQADGFNEAADLRRIEVIRRSGGRQMAYEFSWKNLHRAPAPMEGDVVFVHADVSTRRERQISLTASILSALAAIATTVFIADELGDDN
jgi:protein involved in polysaccharide export with SLBB domain